MSVALSTTPPQIQYKKNVSIRRKKNATRERARERERRKREGGREGGCREEWRKGGMEKGRDGERSVSFLWSCREVIIGKNRQ